MNKIKDKLYFYIVPILKKLKVIQPFKWEISPFRKMLKELGDSQKVLEIGPFFQPTVRGTSVKYFDILQQKELIELSRKYNEQFSRKIPHINEESIPYINYWSEHGSLKVINESFDCVVSSHCIEHQPDLVQHLIDVSELLLDGGKYYLIIPDKRYCFDHFNCTSNLADVLDAHQEKRIVHSLRSIISHKLSMQIHNDPARHWKGNHGVYSGKLDIVKEAIGEFESQNYIDVHAWYFTPQNFTQILNELNTLGFVNLKIDSLITTKKNSFEFYVVLKK